MKWAARGLLVFVGFRATMVYPLDDSPWALAVSVGIGLAGIAWVGMVCYFAGREDERQALPHRAAGRGPGVGMVDFEVAAIRDLVGAQDDESTLDAVRDVVTEWEHYAGGRRGGNRMRKGIFIPLLDEHREALFDLADREWRCPVDQAAKILIEGLIVAGALRDSRSEPARAEPVDGGA